jgi:hypothetical protein
MKSSFNDANYWDKGSLDSLKVIKARPKSGVQMRDHRTVRPLVFKYGTQFKNKSTEARQVRMTKQLLALRQLLQVDSANSHLHLTTFFKSCGFTPD